MPLSISDQLALSRTVLANERTLLAYFRSFIVIFSSGIAIIKIKDFQSVVELGYFLCVIAPLLFVIGVIRYYYTKNKINRLEKQFKD